MYTHIYIYLHSFTYILNPCRINPICWIYLNCFWNDFCKQHQPDWTNKSFPLRAYFGSYLTQEDLLFKVAMWFTWIEVCIKGRVEDIPIKNRVWPLVIIWIPKNQRQHVSCPNCPTCSFLRCRGLVLFGSWNQSKYREQIHHKWSTSDCLSTFRFLTFSWFICAK